MGEAEAVSGRGTGDREKADCLAVRAGESRLCHPARAKPAFVISRERTTCFVIPRERSERREILHQPWTQFWRGGQRPVEPSQRCCRKRRATCQATSIAVQDQRNYTSTSLAPLRNRSGAHSRRDARTSPRTSGLPTPAHTSGSPNPPHCPTRDATAPRRMPRSRQGRASSRHHR
ncbi:MAG: hypothetical protein JWM95_4268 [Gemmatimonadetes bacterium]|nr:hypothetical protein [Gemmatimonadota bacterium]